MVKFRDVSMKMTREESGEEEISEAEKEDAKRRDDMKENFVIEGSGVQHQGHRPHEEGRGYQAESDQDAKPQPLQHLAIPTTLNLG